jgi:uncharacterized OB-fold protein
MNLMSMAQALLLKEEGRNRRLTQAAGDGIKERENRKDHLDVWGFAVNMGGSNATRPRPLPTAYSAFFWDGAQAGRLLIQRCCDCKCYLHPPGPVCPRCLSEQLAPAEVSGRGVLYSFTTIRHLFHPAFRVDLPYIVARVELVEQAGLVLVANLRECSPEAAHIGMKLRVIFETVGADVLPQFTPDQFAGAGP